MDQTMFSSPRMECEYLVSCAPAEVLRYIDHKAAHHCWEPLRQACIPLETQAALFAREDRCVDIALARVADPKILKEVMSRHSQDGTVDSSALEAALGNPNAAGGYTAIPSWMKPLLPWVARHGDAGHLKALFHNPRVPLDIISQAMGRTNAFQGLDEDRTAEVLRYALSSPLVKRGPVNTIAGPDLDMYGVMEAVWGSLLTLPVDSSRISVVLHGGLADAGKLMVSSSEFKREAGEPWENPELRYLRSVLDRWGDRAYSEGIQGDILRDAHRGVRENVAAKASLSYERITSYVRSHQDLYVRRGYYAGFVAATLGELKGFEAKDGYNFLQAALRNPFFYRRDNQAIAVWFYKRLFETDPPDDYHPWLTHGYEWHLNKLRESEHPEEYFANVYEASQSDVVAERNDMERQGHGQGLTLEDINRALISLQSKVAAQSTVSWLGWVIAALAGYGLAKMR